MTATRQLVLSVTPNPSIDLLFETDTLVWDDANRVNAPRRRPGGQGINLTRAVLELGEDAVAVAVLGGAPGHEIEETLRAEGTPLEPVWIDGDTRTFVAVRERASGRSLLVNPRGPVCAPSVADDLITTVQRALASHAPRWVACCGSVPPGLPLDVYARIAERARTHGAWFVPDCDGDALRLAAESGCDLLVPNRHEAARLLGTTINGIDDAAEAATQLRTLYRPTMVAIKLGAEGAVAATAEGAWHAVADTFDEDTGTAVGAGDAFLAALLIARTKNATAPDALRSAVVAGTAALSSSGTRILDLDRYRVLKSSMTRRDVRGSTRDSGSRAPVAESNDRT